MKQLQQLPLRVDFAGGWLDVPRFARPGAFIVNCAITPMVSLDNWPYEKPGAGLGGSAAWRMLNGEDPFAGELAMGVGWQDPAVILETGLCVWRSGAKPVLEAKINPDFLAGKMALLWTGDGHNCPEIVGRPRDYKDIEKIGKVAATVQTRGFQSLCSAVRWTYSAQLGEGMNPLPFRSVAHACKYCGAGWGGYALYLFQNRSARDASGLFPIEPYLRGF